MEHLLEALPLVDHVGEGQPRAGDGCQGLRPAQEVALGGCVARFHGNRP